MKLKFNTPTVYNADRVAALTVKAGLPDGRWVLARSCGWPGIKLFYRIKCAWLVFTGKADVLNWTDQ